MVLDDDDSQMLPEDECGINFLIFVLQLKMSLLVTGICDIPYSRIDLNLAFKGTSKEVFYALPLFDFFQLNH